MPRKFSLTQVNIFSTLLWGARLRAGVSGDPGLVVCAALARSRNAP